MSGFNRPPNSVGYGHPPKHTRYKKGTSGNPSGRPKGSKNKMQFGNRKLDKSILKQAELLVRVNGKNGAEHVSLLEAMIRSMMLSAAQGKLGFQKLSLAMIDKAEERKAQEDQDNIEFVIRVNKENNLKRERALALKDFERAESILPLEEHLGIDPVTLEIMLTGPCDADEKALWDKTWASKRDSEALVHKLMSKLKRCPMDKGLLVEIGAANQQILEANIILYKRWLRPLEELIPCQYDRKEFEEMLTEVSKRHKIP
jgi:hypothetical protein